MKECCSRRETLIWFKFSRSHKYNHWAIHYKLLTHLLSFLVRPFQSFSCVPADLWQNVTEATSSISLLWMSPSILSDSWTSGLRKHPSCSWQETGGVVHFPPQQTGCSGQAMDWHISHRGRRRLFSTQVPGVHTWISNVSVNIFF